MQRLANLGDPEPDAKALKKYLCVVHSRYKQLIVSMEAFADLSKLTIEEVANTLKSSDDSDEEAVPPLTNTGNKEKLLFTKEEWPEKYKQEDTT